MDDSISIEEWAEDLMMKLPLDELREVHRRKSKRYAELIAEFVDVKCERDALRDTCIQHAAERDELRRKLKLAEEALELVVIFGNNPNVTAHIDGARMALKDIRGEGGD